MNPYFAYQKKLKDEYPKAYMEWTASKTQANGFTPVKFKYNTSLQGEVVKAMISELNHLGFSRRELTQIFSKKFKMLPSMFDKLINGERSMGVWELPHLLKYSGLTLSIKPSRSSNYSYRIEGIRNELLVIISRVPFFHIIINTENVYDYRVDLSKEEHLRYLKPSDKTAERYFKFIKGALRWYFKTLQNKTNYPFDMVHFKALFIVKFNNNETRHLTVHNKDKEKHRLEIPTEVIETMEEELSSKEYYVITTSKDDI
ncbi:hypothetical protein PG616_01200 [Riemerella anatipestifer]|nr:hypothetical protein [Riemerella anatipestifer]